MPPRFAGLGTFEYEWGMRWKQLEEQEKAQREQLERQLEENRHKLDDDLEAAKHEHQMMMMRQGEYYRPPYTINFIVNIFHIVQSY